MFISDRRKVSGQRIRRKQPANRRLSIPLTSPTSQNEVSCSVGCLGRDVKSSVPAPSFIVGFYRPDNNLMAYQGERSQTVKVAQPSESQLRTQQYLKQTTDAKDHVICGTGSNMAAYSTRHVHAPKPTVPPKPRVCNRRSISTEKDFSGQIHQSSGPVLSQALKLERFKTPDCRNLPSTTRIHAWVEEQAVSERRSNQKKVQKRAENCFSIMEDDYRKQVQMDAGNSSNEQKISGNVFSISHQLLREHERVYKSPNHQIMTERSPVSGCFHTSECTTDIPDTASLRNACAKWFGREDLTTAHQYVTGRQSNYVDLSRNIKSTNEPDKVVQKEAIGRLHQDTTKRRQAGEDEDKSSSESGRGTMQSGMMSSKHHLDISLDSDHSGTVWKVQHQMSNEESCREPSASGQTSHTKSQSQILLRPKAESLLPERALEEERKDMCQRSPEIRGQSQGTPTHRNNTVKISPRRNRDLLSDLDSTTTAVDLESLTLNDGDDVTSSFCCDGSEMAIIRRQLEGLESMYGEILRLLGVKNRTWKIGNSRNSFEYYRSGRSKRIRGSLSSLTGKSGSIYREKSHHKNDRRRNKETRTGGPCRSSRRLQRLECHVVTLARNVARLSSEMRTQHHLVRELDALRQDVAWVRDQLQIVQSAPSSVSGQSAKNWETLRNEVLQILNPGRIRKLTKFFGSEPPLLRQFLRRLGYEKYAPNFETEKIGIMELPYLNEEKLQKLGVPMGPRIRILQEAHLTFRQNDLKIYIV